MPGFPGNFAIGIYSGMDTTQASEACTMGSSPIRCVKRKHHSQEWCFLIFCLRLNEVCGIIIIWGSKNLYYSIFDEESGGMKHAKDVFGWGAAGSS